jgi:inhibitor of cysteine peptidase
MSEITIVQSDVGKTFAVRRGDLIVIRLAENPTTGYRWEVDMADDRVIALQGSDYAEANGAGIGGGGTRTFTFKAQAPGTVQVALRLRREWEPEDSAIDRFDVTIRVQAP